jgi:serine O-acetyltransferase
MLRLVDDLWRDLDRLARMGATPVAIAFDPAAWAVAIYRIGRALLAMPAPLRLPLRLLHRPLELAVRAVTGVNLPLEAEIGGGLYIAHTGGIRVSPLAHIGRDCNLSRGATIELGARRGESGAPWIGDRVYIGPGVRVTGPVRIGNDAAIGANALVNGDVPDGGAVGGPPPKAVPNRAARASLLPGRHRPPAADQIRKFLRGVLPRPTQILLRTG